MKCWSDRHQIAEVSNIYMLTLLKRISFVILKIIVSLILILLLIILFLYSGTTVYDFPKTTSFAGDQIFNPYENLPALKFKANFHAHSYSWSGITHGANTEKELYDAYTNRGYDITCISNYHKISAYHKKLTDLYVPAYEHGFNIHKAHYLAINAKKVSFWDFPLWQNFSHQQTIIDVLRQNAEIVALAHPKFGGGRSFEGMQTLVGYHLTEVLNHYRNSEEYWDKALSAGKLSWITGNDDIHDLKDPEIFKIWNIIYSDVAQRDTLMSNIKRGKNYAVESFEGLSDNSFISCIKQDDSSFLFTFENVVDTLVFIGQNGIVRQKIIAKNKANYSFRPDDTYIRVVAKNKNSNMYLNPLVKYSGSNILHVSNIKANEKVLYTWLLRLSLFAVMMVLLYWWKRFLLSRPFDKKHT